MKLSVAMITYNQEKSIGQAIENVLAALFGVREQRILESQSGKRQLNLRVAS
jgi:hypothetical protein